MPKSPKRRPSQAEAEAAVRTLIEWAGDDPDREGLLETPKRVAKAYRELERDGKILISARNTWAVYKVDHHTGETIWTLGGKRSSFSLGPGAAFAFQHDVRPRALSDGTLTMFDDGAGPPYVHAQSRALKLRLDLKHMTATVVTEPARPSSRAARDTLPPDFWRALTMRARSSSSMSMPDSGMSRSNGPRRPLSPERTAAGRSAGRMRSSSPRSSARSMTDSSSRTLPGQS